MKITYIIEDIAGSGGMESELTKRLNYLASLDGFKVSLVTAHQMGRQMFFSLDKKIKYKDLSVDFRKKNGWAIRREYRRKMTDFLKQNPTDICVSMGGQDSFFLPKIKDGSKKIVEYHFAFDIYRQWIRNEHCGLFWDLIGYLKTRRMIRTGKRFDKIVVLTIKDVKRWIKFTDKIEQIYNPLTISPTSFSSCTNKIVMAAGRLNPQKGFDFLVDAWKIVSSKYPDWNLYIWGEGPLRSDLQSRIDSLNLTDSAILKGATKEIVKEYINSSIFVLSSRFEGFANVVIEAMACGLPIVAYNCPTGPDEAIVDKKNGFIVPEIGDIQTLADKMCKLIENEKMRESMGLQSRELSKQYMLPVIMGKWLKLFMEMQKHD
jgi:glycosyltransferase involved in cell wall biosynthesis